jgi:hypothetical protein
MMSKPAETKPVRRWVHEQDGDELDAHLGDVFRSIEGEQELPPATLAAVGRRLLRGPERARRRPLRAMPLVLAVLTAGVSAALANWALPARWNVQSLFASAPQPRPVSHLALKTARPPSRSSGQGEVAAPALAPSPAEQGTEPTPVSPAPSRSVVSAPSSALEGPSTPSALAVESELLQRALAKLRRDRDPNGALNLLDEYQAKYPRGVLSLEAAVARVDALLILGRRSEALERLSRLPLERVGRRIELQLVRGELYSDRDCSRAIADFSAVLTLGSGGPFAERALYGRAMCRLRQNDPAAPSDLRAYLARYPNGRFADAMRQQLVAESSR